MPNGIELEAEHNQQGEKLTEKVQRESSKRKFKEKVQREIDVKYKIRFSASTMARSYNSL